jgi:hypothetical protein
MDCRVKPGNDGCVSPRHMRRYREPFSVQRQGQFSFHNVYIDPCSYAAYKKTSVFPEGTIFFKKLQLTLPGQNSDGSRSEPSGRSYFPGRWKWLPGRGAWGELNDRDCCISFPFTGIIGASHQT